MPPRTLAEQNGPAIRELRIREGRSIQELANAVGCSYSHLANVETETKRPTPELLYAIARALGCRPAALFRTHINETAEAGVA